MCWYKTSWKCQLLDPILSYWITHSQSYSLRSILILYSHIYTHNSPGVAFKTKIVYGFLAPLPHHILKYPVLKWPLKKACYSFCSVSSVLHRHWLHDTFCCSSYMNSNIVFLITKSYWPYYHYMIPWDYQTGEYGNYGKGCTSTFIRIWAAMGLATDLRTVDPTSITNSLLTAKKTGTSIKECLRYEDNYSKQYNETEEFLKLAKSL